MYPEYPASSRPFHQTDLTNPKQVLDFVVSNWESRHRYMSDLEQQWVENIAFFIGEQWSQYEPRKRRMVARRRPSGRVRLVINKILPMVLRRVAAVLRGRPTWKVRPATNDYEDIAISRLSSKVLQAYWLSVLKMHSKLKELAIWAETTGSGWLKVTWDDFLGPPMDIKQEFLQGQEEGPLGALVRLFGQQPETGNVSGFLGDARIDVRSPFEMHVDPGCTKIEDATWVTESKAVPITWLMDRYPNQTFNADADDAQYEARYFLGQARALSSGTPGLYEQKPQNQDLAIMHQLWTWPTRKYPYGTFATVVNNRVLELGENPYDFRKPPYAFFTSIDIPGQVHGTCALRQAISPQVALNRARSHMEELRRRLGKPPWLVPEGSGVQKTQLSGDEPGEFVEHAVGLRPEMAQVPVIPDWVARLPSEARGDFADVVSQHAATEGQQPGSVRSGSAIDTLVETDAQANLVSLENYREGLAEAGSMLLNILSTHITQDRLIKLVGEEYETESFFFTGNSLVGEKKTPGVDYFDVVVEMVNGGPLTSAGRLNHVDRLVERGILQVDTDREKIFRILDLGWDEPFLDENRAERGNIAKENVEMMLGNFPQPQTYDNDLAHVVGHRRFQKLPEYRKASPLSRQLFEQHIFLHAQRLKEAMQIRGQMEPQAQQAQPSQLPAPAQNGAQ